MSQSEAAKQAAVAWIREQMDHHGLTFDHLVEAGCFADVDTEDGAEAEAAAPEASPAAPASTAPRVLYRNAMGQTWDGTGEYPDWLQRAVNAGQSIDFYRVD
ncbi:H-NS family nucleoid-associated regulatory protein [Cupriavidus pauculus]|uniref:H-NS family nucleoid-associated regulatory protein n=1 Tax=Cupriavidus pauculus TaxID=82633 RepID=UPI001EE255FF|nr:H-NS family nucleoid-associated regulatory protein [Cupriavidus pauculus]GJG95417.1 H-NS histone family protein [Cupriavidus pauculus]